MVRDLPIPRAVIFDMDGLLLDSERVAVTLIARAAAALGQPWGPELGLSLVGIGAQDSDVLIRRELGEHFPIAALRTTFDALYDAAISAGEIPLKPGVVGLFDLLEELGVPKAVATSTRRPRALSKLGAARLTGRLAAVICGDDVERVKPAPDVFLAAARALSVEPEGCLVLEDSNAGVRGAQAAGMSVVMVPDLVAPAEDVLAAAVRVVDTLDRVAGLLRQARSDLHKN
jgi:HAD superfamily hydrolase (TIGR01509 family)